jgi:hypothetical protein
LERTMKKPHKITLHLEPLGDPLFIVNPAI